MRASWDLVQCSYSACFLFLFSEGEECLCRHLCCRCCHPECRRSGICGAFLCAAVCTWSHDVFVSHQTHENTWISQRLNTTPLSAYRATLTSNWPSASLRHCTVAPRVPFCDLSVKLASRETPQCLSVPTTGQPTSAIPHRNQATTNLSRRPRYDDVAGPGGPGPPFSPFPPHCFVSLLQSSFLSSPLLSA